jgi:AraC family transcriptional regulator of adaptative response/methylated-DNA-[protein]-cysteine methyltransferase
MDSDYQRVARAIEYLVEHRAEQPSLDDVATHVGYSSFHFQRVFKRYAGISPKQFLAALTLESAKPLLRTASVLDAALGVGLSSPSRLHDHFVTIDAVSPGEFKSGGAGTRVRYGYAETPFGRMRAGASERGITMLDFVGESDVFSASASPLPNARYERDDAIAARTARELFGDSPAPLRLHLRGTNFQLRVWNALLRVPEGTTATYGQLARAIGEPTASRAVGNAIAHNPVALLIPCHRVIAGTGAVGNYRWGSGRKRALLAWEAARRE